MRAPSSPTRRLAVALALVVPTAIAAVTLVPATAATAGSTETACDGFTTNGVTATVTCSFTGDLQSFTVPQGVSTITVDAFGAQGGDVPGFDQAGSAGGLGGEAAATLSESAGTVLSILVGGQGYSEYSDNNEHVPNGEGYGGGGASGSRGGQGGGGSYVSDPSNDPLVIAGGGGGGGDEFSEPGGSGGGLAGDPGNGNAGGGGTQIQGGAAGGPDATGGSQGQGGAASASGDGCGGGGGGGGYFGGGAGDDGCNGSEASDGSGGGGSGFGPDGTTFTNGVQSGNGSVTISYQLAATSTTLTTANNVMAGIATTFSATVSPTPDSGTVQFTVDGNELGSPVDVSQDGSATSPSTILTAGNHTVFAIYSGSSAFGASTGSESFMVAPVNPTITATTSSAHHETTYGWYRSPIVVTFHCTAGSGSIAGRCPTADTVRAQGRNQQVTATVAATDGGSASVTVSHLNLDRTKPTVGVKGAKDGATYRHRRHLTCAASDSLSGIASCHVSSSRTAHTVHWTATATDRAGNSRTAVGHYRIRAA